MGDIMSSLGTIGTDVMQGFQGAGQALGDLTGFSGGGGPLSPGTLNSIAQNFGAAPNALGQAMDTVANVGGGALSTASAMAGPPMSIAPSSTLGDITSDVTAPGGLSNIQAGAYQGLSTTGVGEQPQFMQQTPQGLEPYANVMGPQTSTIGAGAPTLTSPAIDTNVGQLMPGMDVNPAGLGSGFLHSLLSDPNMLARLGKGGAALSALLGAHQKPAGLAEIKALEQQQAGLAKNQGALALGEESGLLPAGVQSAYQRILDANLSKIRQNYAERGLTGSSAEMQDLAAARMDVQNQIVQQGQELANNSWSRYTGATNIENTLLNTIMQQEQAQQEKFRTALAGLATALTS